MSRPVLIMAGGTGGHVIPALAVARYLREQGASVVWLGTHKGIEAELVPAAGFDIEWLNIGGLRGKGVMTRLLGPLRILLAMLQAGRILLRRRPAVVLGFGGFVTGPGGLVARLLGYPLVIHEQNARAGLTNRLLARVATHVLEAFPGSLPARHGAVTTGNPVRREIAALDAPPARLAEREGPLRLLVIGGSLGAQVLNETVPAAVAGMPAGQRPLIRHQAGKRNIDQARQAYEQAGVAADVTAFIDDMAAAYDWADLVICRAGALTVSELAAAGAAAILVPYPHAVDDHQTRNAQFLSEAGAAELLPQSRLNAELLRERLRHYADARDELQGMAAAARGRARVEATRQVADYCLRYVEDLD